LGRGFGPDVPRYAETQNWKVKLSESTEMGGFKEAMLEIQGGKFIAS